MTTEFFLNIVQLHWSILHKHFLRTLGSFFTIVILLSAFSFSEYSENSLKVGDKYHRASSILVDETIPQSGRLPINRKENPSIQSLSGDPLAKHHDFVNGLISSTWESNFLDVSSYTEVSGQTIFSDLTAFAGTYSIAGDGSQGNPYIFENLFFNASVSEMYFDTISAYFKLRNSIVLGKMTMEGSNVMSIEGTVFFSTSYALRLLGMQNMLISGNTFVGNGTTYALAVSGSQSLDIGGNTFITGVSAGAVSMSTGTLSITNVNLTQNLFQTQYTGILATSGLSGVNGMVGNVFNSSSASTFITVIPMGNFEFSDNTIMIHYTPNRWDGAIFLSGIGGSASDLWVVRNNTISGLEDGLSFYDAKNLELENNTISDCLHGVKFYQVHNQFRIRGNLIESTSIGFYVRSSNNNTIDSSILRQVDFGAMFESATSNVLNNTQIEDSNWLMHDLTDNSPPNQEINTLETGMIPTGVEAKSDADFETWISSNNFSGSGTLEDPYVIEGVTISGGLGLSVFTNHSIKVKDVIIEKVYNDLIKPLSVVSATGIILENVSVVGGTNGIYLETTGTLIIKDLSLSGLMDVSTIRNAKSVSIQGVNFADSDKGLVLSFLSNAFFTEFQFMDVLDKQLFIEGANNLTLSHGNLTRGGEAMYVIGSNQVTVLRVQ